jgi:hypothetical protein
MLLRMLGWIVLIGLLALSYTAGYWTRAKISARRRWRAD